MAGAALAQPVVIAHRGASGERPEHTLAAYRRAIEQGADFIEPDLVMTKDDVLVIRHENNIADTTDVADHPEFADRRTSKTIDGHETVGWFTEDFTLAELKTLHARERLPQIRPANAGWLEERIASFDEALALVRATPRRLGIYPETKHPSYFQSIGKPMERAVVDALARAGFTRADDPVFIQSFEVTNLKALRGMTKLRLVQLIDGEAPPYDQVAAGTGMTIADMVSPPGLRAIAGYADAIGPYKLLIEPRDAAGQARAPTTLVGDARAAGLLVHSWTFRSENIFLPAGDRIGEDQAARGDAAAEYARFLGYGVDGLFSDFPGEAVKARAAFLAKAGAGALR
ncbi:MULTISPECIES: glycerophosphodiester phosphodiesterase [unclassified Sphingomonas]|uniref:glycerophosphodiester phosphodiesterase n=1 Tax=unclassified Sphingomonas TaxID=196159 RepID=UPI0006F79874|nr:MULTISPECIES: glycerophosphodiester phosphodiesterase [unclassified Sphingomonas]KQX19682.1 glycerophosphodiester phosphodiesterase [Sphingomonas sp. Root1294]KQY65883.1 glycerophosphodiester phosphodiesterase [Sphingomonas sp. Root50]KRB95546.1 glycerophosphodiester phosphodiesterase [Sphingomonas sp. Root720]